MTLFELVGKIVIKNKEANDSLKGTSDTAANTAESVGKSGGKISDSFKKVGAAVATFLTVDAIKNFGLGCIQAAADANAASSQFTQVFGDLESKASKSLTKIADTAGISENRMKGSYTKIAAFAKTTGMDTESALSLTERAMVAVADSAAFYDRSLEETTESLQSFLKGNFENDAALGLSCTETTRNAAANALYGKSFKDLSESQKQLTLLQMVEDANKLSGALGQAARESDTWTNVTGNLKQSWTDFQAVLGTNVLPFAVGVVKSMAEGVTGLTEKVPAAVEKFHSFVAKAKEVGGYVGDTLKPIFDDVKFALDKVKDAVQPIIDKFTDYVSSGGLAEDVTNGIKDAADFLADAYETVKGFISDVVQGFKDAATWGKEHETALTLIAVAVGTLTAAIVAYNVAQAIKNAGGIVELAQLAGLAVGLGALTVAETAHTVATTIATAATTAFGAVLSFITSPITLVVVAIGALIAIGVLLYKNWDEITAAAADLWAKVTEWFGKIKDAVVGWAEDTIASVKEWAGNVAKWFGDMKDKASEKLNQMKQKAAEHFNAIKDTTKKVMTAAKETVDEKLTAMKSAYDKHGGGIKGIAAAAIEGVKGYYTAGYTFIDKLTGGKLSEIAGKFKSGMENAKNAVFEKLGNIKTKFTSIFDNVMDIVRNAVTALKNAFKFDWSLPKLKLPHIKVSGGEAPYGIGGKGSLPSFKIDWYAKAMNNPLLMNSPTIFGFDPETGKARGGGEAGSEVVSGTNTLMNMIGSVVESKTAAQNDRIVALLTALLEAITGGNEELLKALLAGQTIVLNKREIGRTVREFA